MAENEEKVSQIRVYFDVMKRKFPKEYEAMKAQEMIIVVRPCGRVDFAGEKAGDYEWSLSGEGVGFLSGHFDDPGELEQMLERDTKRLQEEGFQISYIIRGKSDYKQSTQPVA